MRRFVTLSVLAAASLGVSACVGIGSGTLITEERAVGPFDSLRIDSAVNVELVVDPDAEIAVSVTYDDDIIDQIITKVEGDTLVVDLDQNISLSGSGRSVSVTMNSLSDITVSGAVDLNGRGEADSYQLTVSGASDVDLGDITATEVALDVSGSSDVRIHASGSVVGTVSGVSEVTVLGDPANVRVETSGVSDLNLED